MRIKLKCPHCNRHQIHEVLHKEGAIACGDCGRPLSYRVKPKPVKDPVDYLRDLFGGFR